MKDQLSSDLASLRIQRDENPDARSGRRRWLAAVMALLVATCVGVPAWQLFGARVFKTDVEVTEIRFVSPAQAQIQVTSSGFVAARSESKVGARLSGRVAEVLVREGDAVELGQVLVRLDDADARMAIAAARARAAAARARVQSAVATQAETRRTYERERGLAEKGAALRSTVEDLEGRALALDETANAARADAAAAAAELSQLELNLEYMTVTAPIAGVVVSDPVDVGELVGPTTAPVLELADFTTLVVETDVPEARLGLVERGGPAEIVLDAWPAVRHRGRVTEISPRVNRAKATVVVRVEFTDPVEGVLPDMAARVSFLAGELDAEAVKEPPRLFVPASAVVERGGDKVVFRIDDGAARLERVTLGPAMSGGFELLAGPGDGTRVIAAPPSSIDDGYPVREGTE
jgi:HlyD family secretion protein